MKVIRKSRFGAIYQAENYRCSHGRGYRGFKNDCPHGCEMPGSPSAA